MLEFDYLKMNTFGFLRCSKNDVSVFRLMFDPLLEFSRPHSAGSILLFQGLIISDGDNIL